MNLDLILKKYESHTNQWLVLLSDLPEKNYTFKPSPEVWSVSEMMDHVIQVTRKCLANAQQCMNLEGETGHSGFGPAVFSFMGSFPPVKLHIKTIPAGMETVYKPALISKKDAVAGLKNCLQHMADLKTAVEKSDKKQRIAHWAGGWFNARQWYHSAEMHLKHHFRQFNRLKKKFPKTI
jgi:DinB superfamily